jgi:phage terminase large subunit-like protein
VEPDRDSPGNLAVEFAATAGLHLDPWQRLVLTDALAQRPDGRWAAREACLICPRQQGKGSVLEALELFSLFMPEPGGPPPLVLHSAHEYKTADEHFRRMRDLIDGSDRLRKQVRIVRTASGAQAIELVTGARLRFVTRTSGSGRGFSADLVVMDEAYNLSDESMAAVLPTLAARPNPQIWYTSSAGMPSSEVLTRLRTRGLAGGDPQLAYFEWSAADGADLDDVEAWAQANPALGVRVSLEAIQAERAALSDEQFGRERLGLWADKQQAPAIDPDLWSSYADPGAERGSRQTFGLAVAPDRSWSAIAVAWRRPDGRAQVMLADYRPGTAWVLARATELRERWGGPLMVDMAARGLVSDAVELSTSAQAQAHNALATALEGGDLRHGNESALNYAVRAARWKPQGDSRVLDRKGGADISPLVAAALAMHGLKDDGPSVYEDRELVTL